MFGRTTGRTNDEFTGYVSARMPSLFRSAFLLSGGDRHLADDVVQATVFSLYVHWQRARRADNLDAYVQRMLFRKLVDAKRSRWRRVRLMWGAPEPPAGPDPGVDDSDEIMAALRWLPMGQRTVLVLRHLNDLSVEETARVMGCSIGNVKSQTSRAIAAMRPLLEDATTLNGTGES